MAIIGTFTRDECGVFNGTIRTLTLNLNATIRPCPRDHDKAPDYRLSANGFECGAAWTKTSRDVRPYLSIKLDDPSLPAPIYAKLIDEGDGQHLLIWLR